MAIAGITLGTLGIIATGGYFGVLYHFGFKANNGPFIEVKVQATKQILAQNAGALELYKKQYGTYPESLDAAKQAGFTVFPTDFYQTPFQYSIQNNGQSYELKSFGPDLRGETGDDIAFTEPQQAAPESGCGDGVCQEGACSGAGWNCRPDERYTCPQDCPLREQPSKAVPFETPQSADFEFTYAFGVGEKNKIDTRTNQYTKDMVGDPSQDYFLTLTDADKERIKSSFVENDLVSLKENFTENCWPGTQQCFGVTPLSSATLTVWFDGGEKTFRWQGDYYNPQDPEVIRLRNVLTAIEDLIREKENERNIPQPRGGYM